MNSVRRDGYVDKVDNGALQGWAVDITDIRRRVTVAVFHEGERLGETAACLFREDLRRAGIGDGRGTYGFSFPVPDWLRSKRTYALDAYVDDFQLHNSPITVTEEPELPFRRTGGHVRDFLGQQYLYGAGIEIGALHKPMRVPAPTLVRYVDSRPSEELSQHYGREVSGHEIVNVDIVTNADTLTGIDDETQDFVIANHVLEHLENPILAVKNMLRVLRASGIVFLSIPDKRYTFDVDRPVTDFSHVLQDYLHGPELSRRAHYEEWIRVVEKEQDAEGARLRYLMEESRYAIHFHVWTPFDMFDTFSGMRSVVRLPFEIDAFKANGQEAVFVLRKTAH
jgi:SAM-dependent methyltransferase